MSKMIKVRRSEIEDWSNELLEMSQEGGDAFSKIGFAIKRAETDEQKNELRKKQRELTKHTDRVDALFMEINALLD